MNTAKNTHTISPWMCRTAAIGAGLLLLPGLAACTNETAGPETGADVEDVQEGDLNEGEVTADDDLDPYDGVYGPDFYDSITDYADTEVILSANVGEVFTDQAITIAGTDATSVDPLLVIHEEPVDDLVEGIPIQVTGIAYEEFAIADVEERTGLDLDDTQLEEWEGEPYVEATQIDTSPEFTEDDAIDEGDVDEVTED